ncbi:ribonuclease R [Mycoplasma sp. P36-A1]|uniref:ribonuclease R n=1 Tax=Mycoplasma sp. P36-A1 TaxID=3252900 RepID=UPI003C3066DC
MLEEIKDKILKMLNDDNYIPLNYSDIAATVQMVYSDFDLNDIFKAMVDLENDNKVLRLKGDKIHSAERLGLIVGTLEIKRKGFGFVRTENFDVFVSRDNLNGGINKDKVFVKVTNEKDNSNKEGFIYRVIEHGYNIIVGEVKVFKGRLYVAPDDGSLDFAINISKKNINGASEGSKVLAVITNVDKNTGIVSGKIKDVIGHINDIGIDILSVVYKYDFDPTFSQKTIDEAKSYTENDIVVGKRRDLRNQTTITIDGADAKDLDDAVYLEINEKGNRVLYVSIADVSHYVTENSSLDDEAYTKGTSVYLVDRVVPMLPHQLSNGICSLLPDVDRLTQTCKMEFNDKGKVIDFEIFESIINSKYRMTYDEVNDILVHDNKATQDKYQEIYQMLLEMHELSKKLRKTKIKRGMLEFEIPEPKILVDKKGKPTEIIVRERGEGERVIEDFMIIANETVASAIYHMELPFIYRVHEEPNPDKISNFLNYASVFDVKLKLKGDKITPLDVQRVLNEINAKGDQLFLDRLLLRSMSKARYDSMNLGHFGLASKNYTHFTSPIRRYPDLIVHRLLRKYLYDKDIPKNGNEMEILVDKIQKAADKSSTKERDAIEAEREVNDMKMAEYMVKYVGGEFEGIITSVTSFGFFVELENTVEGLVHISNLKDDHYIYDDKFHQLRGQNKNKTYALAQRVTVICDKVDVKQRNIDFIIKREK